MSEQNETYLKEVEAIENVYQEELLCDISESKTSEAMMGGCLWAMVDAAADQANLKEASELLKPINDDLLAFDFRKDLKAKLESYAFSNATWLKDSQIEVDNTITQEKILVRLASTDKVLVIYTCSYFLTNDFDAVIVKAAVSVYIPDLVDEKKPKPTYYNEFYYKDWLTDSKDRKENSEIIASDITTLKNNLMIGNSEVIKMFEYDVSIYKEKKLEDGKKIKVKDISGKSIKEEANIWLRQGDGTIYAFKAEHAK